MLREIKGKPVRFKRKTSLSIFFPRGVCVPAINKSVKMGKLVIFLSYYFDSHSPTSLKEFQ